MVAWAIDLSRLGVVLVVEPGPIIDTPPVIHMAVPVVVPDSVDRVLAERHWRARVWIERTLGRVARVDLADADTSGKLTVLE